MATRPNKRCHFCTGQIRQVDYKDVRLLSRYVNMYGKIDARKRSGNCAKHQRMTATAIKRSRLAALMPYTVR
ncbi:30S ribosomal protein S18 [Patescibacteria group bacterium]|nr:30S ribosomal protein S18 [Patescibacteria group bacterium]